ncbi:hypothetical protein Tcan_05315 [Toxocara canis]|uniref:Serpentine receptor class gamma n=1 Tax=Toxocara canis TaxID=6265 RepID=A0A0B2W6Q7_TOXCA|nr:hypothetical protein Tcan_05315 [Toxocara canis]
MDEIEAKLKHYTLVSSTPFCLKVIELPLILFASFCAVILTIALISKRSFHSNFIVVFVNVELSFLINMFTRFVEIMLSFKADPRYYYLFATADAMNDASSYSIAFNMVTLVIERISAALLVNRYEKFSAPFPYYGIFLAIIQASFCVDFL